MNLQRCRLVEPLRSDNGALPNAPILLNGALSSAFSLPSARDLPAQSDTRLRIFSGTANPDLSQVNLQYELKFFVMRGQDWSCYIVNVEVKKPFVLRNILSLILSYS